MDLASPSVGESRPPENADSSLRLRRLWQVPMFFLGLAAMVTVALGRPSWRPATDDSIARDLDEARAAIDPPHPDFARAFRLADKCLSHTNLTPEQAGLAHFVVGSCLLQRAVVSDQARDWVQAHDQLTQAEAFGVPRSDEPALVHRLARSGFHADRPPEQVIAYLLRAIQAGGGDQAELYGMLSRCYLRLPQPDYASALDAINKQLALPNDNDLVLAPARLLRGEVLLHLGQRQAAREALEYIKPSAPPDIYAHARWLRATSCQQEGLYEAAQKLWEALLQDPAHCPADPDRIRYDLGVCYLQEGYPARATAVWSQASRSAGEVGQAAAFRLAELRLQDKDPSSAQAVLQTTLQPTTAAAYKNSLLSLERARQVCEQACSRYIQVGKYQLSCQLALLYGPLATPGRAQQLIGQALDAWAADLRQHAHGPDASRALDEARQHDHEAGEAYELASQQLPAPADRAEAVRLGADRYMTAGDFPLARTTLIHYLTLELPADRRAAGLFTLGLVLESLHQDAQASDAYHQCIAVAGNSPFAFRARYQLGEAEMEKGRLDSAREILEQNLHLMAFDPDPEAHENTLLALAELLYKRGDFQLAAQHLRDALEQYPSHPRAAQARLTLAACYQRLAARENDRLREAGTVDSSARAHYEQQYRLWLNQAVANDARLTKELRARANLSDADAAILRQAEFAEAECRFDLGQYDTARECYETLATRYAPRAASLDALTQVTRCYWVKNQPDQALQTIDRIRTVLKATSDEELRGSIVAQTRAGWEGWLKDAAALCVRSSR